MTTLSHVEFYVADAITQAAEFRRLYGFEVVAVSEVPEERDHFSVVLRQGAIVVILTEARSAAHPAASYVESHGDGVADITLQVPDARAAHAEAVRRGAEPWAGAALTIHAFGDVRHTFVDDGPVLLLPGLPPIERAATPYGLGLLAMDHFAVCLPQGELTAAVSFYESVLDMSIVFKERIVVGSQAMRSEVVQSADRTVTLTLIEPDPDSDPGQIDDFIKNHGGAGVQHIAFSSADAVAAVSALVERGVEFLQTPAAYYEQLTDRLTLSHHDIGELRQLNLLVDEDQDGQLFQIFTRATHPRHTLFFEVIERLGARTFGSGNIKALYQAVEVEQTQARVPSVTVGADEEVPALLALSDAAAAARARLKPKVWDFIAGGSGSESTLAGNREALGRVWLVPRALAGIKNVDTTTTLLGYPIGMPVAVAPMGYQRLCHPDGEPALARACRALDIVFTAGIFSSATVEEIAATGALTWFQLYWLRDRGRTAELIGRAERAGCRALMVTVDVPRMGRRLRDMRNGFALPPGVIAANLGDGTGSSAHRRVSGDSAVIMHTTDVVAPDFGWSDLAWLRAQTRLPLVVKGLLHPGDAVRAAEAGADAVVVSNHGGRQLDGSAPSVAALPAVVNAVPDGCSVLFDSGVRSGTDVLKALALGAHGVLLGRPALWGLAVGGETGAARVLRLLHEELADAMLLAGSPDVAAARQLPTMIRGDW